MSETNSPSFKWKIISAGKSALHTDFLGEFGAELMAAARVAKKKAYAPYSKFHVGAAVSMTDEEGRAGRIHFGCNVENASYGATMCAERSAIFPAVAAGGRKIRALALTLDSMNEENLSQRAPCGLCRQVINEFADASTAIIIDAGEKNGIEFTGEVMGIADLLPWGFEL